jgi:aryl sulfotransferase
MISISPVSADHFLHLDNAFQWHLPFDALPIFNDVRYIHVARDGGDACLSYHNQITRFSPEVAQALSETGLEDETIGKP